MYISQRCMSYKIFIKKLKKIKGKNHRSTKQQQQQQRKKKVKKNKTEKWMEKEKAKFGICTPE